MSRLVLVGAFVAAVSAVFIWPRLEDFKQLKINQVNLKADIFNLKADIFDTYVLALQWPPATCSGRGRRFNCIKPYLSDFTVHGLWPQLPSGDPVPPYSQAPSCTNVTPVQPDKMMAYLRDMTQKKLRSNWPNLVDYQGKNANEYFWKSEWEKHGMCADWPVEPNDYFVAGLEVQKNFLTFLSTLQDAQFKPDAGERYAVGDISNALRSRYGGKSRLAPEIACNEDADGVKQLWEVRFCFQRKRKEQPTVLVSCRNFFSIRCSQKTDQVRFPPVSSIPDLKTETNSLQYA